MTLKRALTRWRLIAIVVSVLTALSVALVGTTAASAAKADRGPAKSLSNKYGETSSDFATTVDGRDVKGSFVPKRFSQKDGQLMVTGFARGTVENKAGKAVPFNKRTTLPVESINGESASGGRLAGTAVSCDILNLVLGPLDLNLLGLEIHLDTVVLDIIATPAGGLLGQLLCAVANLLDGGLSGLLQDLVDTLNDILGVLQR